MDRQHFTDVPCPFCGCLCDDLEIDVTADRIARLQHDCPVAQAAFLAPPANRAMPCKLAGRVVTRNEAVTRAAQLLSSARSPLVHGLSGASCEAQGIAVEIAERIGGVLDVPGSRASLAALQTVGANSCTLGEIRQRADLIVVWHCDPITTHPRFFERYVSSAAQVIVVDSRQSATVALARQRIDVAATPAAVDNSVQVLLALLRETAPDLPTVLRETGAALDVWRELLVNMRRAKYGVLLHEAKPDSPTERRSVESLHRLTRQLNDATRFICQELPPPGNALGAENVVAWRSGHGPAVDFSHGYPQYIGGIFPDSRAIERGEIDAALVIGADPLGGLDSVACDRWRQIPIVAIDCRETATTAAAEVVLPIAMLGVESGGTMFRMDGVPLRLRPVLEPRHPSDYETLVALNEAIRAAIGIAARRVDAAHQNHE